MLCELEVNLFYALIKRTVWDLYAEEVVYFWSSCF